MVLYITMEFMTQTCLKGIHSASFTLHSSLHTIQAQPSTRQSSLERIKMRKETKSLIKCCLHFINFPLFCLVYDDTGEMLDKCGRRTFHSFSQESRLSIHFYAQFSSSFFLFQFSTHWLHFKMFSFTISSGIFFSKLFHFSFRLLLRKILRRTLSFHFGWNAIRAIEDLITIIIGGKLSAFPSTICLSRKL